MLDQPVEVFFIVALLGAAIVLLRLVLLFVRVAVVDLFGLPRVVRVVVFFATAGDFPILDGVWDSSEESSLVVSFLRGLLRADAPYCSGLSPATC